jgi:hypothetical protein
MTRQHAALKAKLDRKSRYAEYLASPEWRERRDRAIERAEGRCQLCNSDKRLNVHHRTYERLGYERDADLTVLCEDCHQHFHGTVTAKKRNLTVAKKPKGQRRTDIAALAREFGPLEAVIRGLIEQKRAVTVKQVIGATSERSRAEVKKALAAMVRHGEIYEPTPGYWGFRSTSPASLVIPQRRPQKLRTHDEEAARRHAR